VRFSLYTLLKSQNWLRSVFKFKKLDPATLFVREQNGVASAASWNTDNATPRIKVTTEYSLSLQIIYLINGNINLIFILAAMNCLKPAAETVKVS